MIIFPPLKPRTHFAENSLNYNSTTMLEYCWNSMSIDTSTTNTEIEIKSNLLQSHMDVNCPYYNLRSLQSRSHKIKLAVTEKKRKKLKCWTPTYGHYHPSSFLWRS